MLLRSDRLHEPALAKDLIGPVCLWRLLTCHKLLNFIQIGPGLTISPLVLENGEPVVKLFDVCVVRIDAELCLMLRQLSLSIELHLAVWTCERHS